MATEPTDGTAAARPDEGATNRDERAPSSLDLDTVRAWLTAIPPEERAATIGELVAGLTGNEEPPPKAGPEPSDPNLDGARAYSAARAWISTTSWAMHGMCVSRLLDGWADRDDAPAALPDATEGDHVQAIEWMNASLAWLRGKRPAIRAVIVAALVSDLAAAAAYQEMGEMGIERVAPPASDDNDDDADAVYPADLPDDEILRKRHGELGPVLAEKIRIMAEMARLTRDQAGPDSERIAAVAPLLERWRAARERHLRVLGINPKIHARQHEAMQEQTEEREHERYMDGLYLKQAGLTKEHLERCYTKVWRLIEFADDGRTALARAFNAFSAARLSDRLVDELIEFYKRLARAPHCAGIGRGTHLPVFLPPGRSIDIVWRNVTRDETPVVHNGGKIRRPARDADNLTADRSERRKSHREIAENLGPEMADAAATDWRMWAWALIEEMIALSVDDTTAQAAPY